jgi:hypothetical protein
MNALRALLGILVLAALFGFVAWKAGPGVLRDWRLRNDFAPVMANVGGDCRSYVAVVTYCDVTLTTEAGAVDDTLFFVDFNTQGYDVTVVAAPSDPTQVSTSLAIEKFWNRVATLAGLGAIFLFALVGGVGRMLRPEEAPAT